MNKDEYEQPEEEVPIQERYPYLWFCLMWWGWLTVLGLVITGFTN